MSDASELPPANLPDHDLMTNETVIQFCSSLVEIADDLAKSEVATLTFANHTIANTVRALARRKQ